MRARRPWSRSWLGIACLVTLAATAVAAFALRSPARASSSTAPTVTVNAPDSPLRGSIDVQASATPSAGSGRTIVSVDFQISPAGANSWTTFAHSTSAPYDGTLDTTDPTFVPQNGSYDFRAIATDSAEETQASAVAPDRTVANNATYVTPPQTGTPLRGSVTLTATPEPGGATPNTVTFQASRAGANAWTSIATVGPQLDDNGYPTGSYTTTLDTTTLTDGPYDLRVSAEDGGFDTFQGGRVSNVVVDNTPPTAALSDPGGPLSGEVTLSATADDAGTGVASVRFESAPAGATTWTTIGMATSPPYNARVDTRQLANGSYDLRVEATDHAGNTSISTVRSGVAVSNPAPQRFDQLTVTNYIAPASRMSLLGEIAGSSQHETWAFGYTDAPPPTVNGATLPYTAQGQGQLVLLRYTDDSGWAIADVLRNQDGSAFAVGPGATLQVSGQMTGSGEAWIVLNQQSGVPYAVFHRAPGGSFLLDQGETNTLGPLLNGAPQIRLGQTADGTVYGVLHNSNQPYSVAQEPSPNGLVSVYTYLKYGQLVNGVWSLHSAPLPPDYVAPPQGSRIVKLADIDPTGPGAGWGMLVQTSGSDAHGAVSPPLMLARFDQSGWQFAAQAGLDALDLTDEFAASSHESASAQNPNVTLTPQSLRADGGGVWLSAAVSGDSASGKLVARYDAARGAVVNSWCTGLPRQSFGCAHPLDLDHPAAVPDATFDTPEGLVADALSTSADFVDVYSYGTWTSVATPGFRGSNGGPGQSLFVSPTEGWLAGPNVLAHISSTPAPSALAPWPQANRSPLLSVALAPGQSTTDTPGALAVGLNGSALHYDPSAGWLVDPTPPRAHHLALNGVAFDGASSAFAVGLEGSILHWDGSAWREDPQSVSLTTSTLIAVAFRADGQGWAVGANGTILHYDGTAWSPEQIDPADDGQEVRSVAVAGQDVFALAGGNLIERSPDGSWQRVDPSLLPSPAPPSGAMRLLSGLPDGGLVIAGKSLLMTRDSGSAKLAYAPQSFQGIPVALAAFRNAAGNVRAFVSVAPPVQTLAGLSNDVGGFPSGDGNLIVQTDSGFDDLSHTLSPKSVYAAVGDGAVQPDPVLAVAASPDGSHAWAVGGYAGTHAADGIGTDQILSARPPGWFTSAIWRYDAGGSVQSQAVTQTPDDLPASPNTVSFAFFSSPLCKVQCAAVRDAQPDVNLRSAAAQIASFAQQPGGPAFAMLGGNARGPMDLSSYQHGLGATDLGHLQELLSPLGGLPTYAAYGPRDGVPGSGDPAQPWADAFGQAPAPFGPGAAPPGISPVAWGDATGPVNKYYAFDASQNGGTLRVIVLDNSAGSLEASAPGQTGWLSARLADARASGLPVVVIAARPLDSTVTGAAGDGDAVAAQLAAAGVLGVFTTSGGDGASWSTQTDRRAQVPANAAPGAAQIREYEGATLTYQQPKNNGVLWYDVSVDTQAQTLSVKAIPVISNLALAPMKGLSVARSSTLSFQAIARRPPATLATVPSDQGFPGYDQYVNIPASTCRLGCIGPSYTFTSSNRVVGDFVAASGPPPGYPTYDAAGAPIRSKTSGLFCAFNSGTTTVSVTAGGLTSSLPVTVRAGGYGPPCGTVPGGVNSNVIRLPGRVIAGKALNPGIGLPLQPAGNPAPTPLPKVALPAAPVPAPAVHPKPVVPQVQPKFQPSQVAQQAAVALPPIVVPLIPPALTPVPPGGATVSAQAAAKREEKARKHASQSAYVIRPAGTSASEWFYPAVGAISVLAALLIAGGMRPGPRPKLALVEARESDPRRRRASPR